MNCWLVKALLLTVVLAAQVASRQQIPADSDYRIRTTSELVLLDVTAETVHGRTISGLTKDNFKVYENGKLQPVVSFNHDDHSVSVGLVVDQSGSMRPKPREVL